MYEHKKKILVDYLKIAMKRKKWLMATVKK